MILSSPGATLRRNTYVVRFTAELKKTTQLYFHGWNTVNHTELFE